MSLHVYLRVDSCSVQYSVDELYRCTLSTGSVRVNSYLRLCYTRTLRRDDRLLWVQEEAGMLEQV